MLIPPLALYVAWMRRNVTLAEAAIPNSRGLWLIGAACLLFLLGKVGAEFFISRISFVLLLVAPDLDVLGLGAAALAGVPVPSVSDHGPAPGNRV
jgi:hypothetical protein